jgi:hypothetical protein
MWSGLTESTGSTGRPGPPQTRQEEQYVTRLAWARARATASAHYPLTSVPRLGSVGSGRTVHPSGHT